MERRISEDKSILSDLPGANDARNTVNLKYNTAQLKMENYIVDKLSRAIGKGHLSTHFDYFELIKTGGFGTLDDADPFIEQLKKKLVGKGYGIIEAPAGFHVSWEDA